MNELSQRYYSCFFTGHRILSSSEVNSKIYHELKKKILYMAEEKGVDRFICGGAIGFDTLAAEAVIEMKKSLPYISLVIYIPCYEHYIKWNMTQIEKWKKILSHTDDAVYITAGSYVEGCMQKRNIAMADNAHYCIAYCMLRKSGTGAALSYAEKKNCEIYNLAEYI